MSPKHLLSFRTAAPADADAFVRIDAESWPAGLGISAEQWHARLATFPAGQITALFDGEIAAVAAAQRITDAFLHAGPVTFDRLTDCGTFRNSHDPAGEIYQLVAVGAGALVRGFGVGRKLIDRQIEFARSLPGVKRIVGITRPARYYRHPELAIEQYVELRNKTGRRFDPVLEFHLGSGARLISTHAAFRPDDTEALGYGVLIEYPVV